MAGNLVLNVELLGEYKKLTAATKGANKSLAGFQKSAEKISGKINGAFAAIGIGISFNFIKRELEEASKAAIEDTKSQELLAGALRNTMKATDAQIDSVEAQIKKFQLSASVADDELRPAYSKLAIATGNITEANKLMAIALDVSAGTGKNLDTVVQAMSKALNGNEGALARLVPSVKGAKDPIAELAKTFEGAAETAANTDPYQRMNIIFGEMQEQIGVQLLPYLEDFSAWLASPGGQERLQEIVDVVVDLVKRGGELVDFIIEYREQIIPLSIAITGLGTAAKLASGFVGLLNIALTNPGLLVVAATLAGIAGAMWLVYENTKKAKDEVLEFNRLQGLREISTNPFATPEQVAAATYKGILNPPKAPAASKPVPIAPVGPGKNTPAKTIVQNVTINNAKATAPEIVKELQKQGTIVGKSYLK